MDFIAVVLSVAAAAMITVAAWRSASDGMTRHVAGVVVQGVVVAVGVLVALFVGARAARFARRTSGTGQAVVAVWVVTLAVAFAVMVAVAAGVFTAAYIY